MKVSTISAVLPVPRSPMISSRWPRPIGIIESIALMPVCSGSLTGWRSGTDGERPSIGRKSLGANLISPLPSTARPSASTTRPHICRPVGTDITRPVVRTVSPSLTLVSLPSSTAPTLSSSRLRATPKMPFPKSSISFIMQSSRPCTRAVPSPTISTVPTEDFCMRPAKPAISDFRTVATSDGLRSMVYRAEE